MKSESENAGGGAGDEDIIDKEFWDQN